MKKIPENLKNNILIAVTVCMVIHLFLTRSVFLFLPIFALVLYVLWKRGGGKLSEYGAEEDPADWWKKESQSEE